MKYDKLQSETAQENLEQMFIVIKNKSIKSLFLNMITFNYFLFLVTLIYYPELISPHVRIFFK